MVDQPNVAANILRSHFGDSEELEHVIGIVQPTGDPLADLARLHEAFVIEWDASLYEWFIELPRDSAKEAITKRGEALRQARWLLPHWDHDDVPPLIDQIDVALGGQEDEDAD